MLSSRCKRIQLPHVEMKDAEPKKDTKFHKCKCIHIFGTSSDLKVGPNNTHSAS